MLFNITSPTVGKWSIVINASVCSSVCLPACISQKPHMRSSGGHQFFLHMPPVAVARSSSGGGRCDKLCTSGFRELRHVVLQYRPSKSDANRRRVYSESLTRGHRGRSCCLQLSRSHFAIALASYAELEFCPRNLYIWTRVVHGSILCDPIQPNPSAD